MHNAPRYQYTGVKRFFLIAGGLFVLMGLTLIGVAAYSLLYEKGPAAQLIYVRPSFPSQSTDVAGAVDAPAAPLGDQPYRLVIDAIGVNAPVATFGMDENAVPQVPYERDLVAWYNFSAVPGTGGNAVFAGHVTWYGDAVFKRLGDLRPGDIVALQADDGSRLIYRVTVNEMVFPTPEEARRWLDPTDSDVITLITCGGNYTPNADPVLGGVYDQRVVVRAEFVRAEYAASAEGSAGG